MMNQLTIALLSFFCHPLMEDGAQPAAGKVTEALVHVRAADGIENGVAIFTPSRESANKVAVIWIHGWGVNFYYPTYVKLGRELASRVYACIIGNTRMHDIGTNAGERNGKRLRGGGYWGLPSEEPRDIAGWIDLAMSQGYQHVVLAGHSAGCSAVRLYPAEKQDKRVIGLVLASGGIGAGRPASNPDLLAQATKLVAEGHGADLLRFPNRPPPAFLSAATFLDMHNTRPEMSDFFGIKSSNPPISRIHCPIFACFGTREPEIGGQVQLDELKKAIGRLTNGPRRVDTFMVQNADHTYTGEEAQLAQALTKWADTLLPKKGSLGEKAPIK